VYHTDARAGADTILAIGQPSLLNASGGDFYKWSPSEGLSADDIPNPVVTLNHNQQYVLTVYTEAGCATTDTLNIKVYKGPAIYVPSAFSPNGDGKNDRFQFIAVGMKTVELFQVYNRYGQLVYSSSSLDGWDGRVGGRNAEPGTYVWTIRGIDFNGTIHNKKGTVTLVR
jgi:gliding motility-associated-like protein